MDRLIAKRGFNHMGRGDGKPVRLTRSSGNTHFGGNNMKRSLIVIAVLLLFSSAALADQPLKSLDAFEADMKKCLLQKQDPAGCLGDTMSGHFSPGNEKLNDVVKQVASILKQWLAGNKVYAVHPVKNKALGSFYEERVYLIEDTTGSIIMIETSFIKTLGSWYLHRFNLSSKKDTMQSVLGVNI